MKRRIYFLYIIWVQVVAISLSSCDDELTDINRNPNATENPQPAYLLAAAQYHAANLYWGSSTNYNSTLLWVQHWAKYNIQSQIAIMWIMAALPLRGTPAMQR